MGRGAARPRLARGSRRVFARGLELMASVGVFEIERRYQQRVVVSVELDVIDDYDGVSDRLDGVVDYGHVVSEVRRIVDCQHYNLIETLAERIAEACLDDARVLLAQITIEKPDILPGCRSVGIVIERARDAD
ncbi:MAG: dihydroneopterin aldolase [Hyphomicrobiaceae bacterium]